MKRNYKEILAYLKENPASSSKEVHEGLRVNSSYASVKRILSDLLTDKLVEITGQGKATKYKIAASYNLFYPVDIEDYFLKEIDERHILKSYTFSLISDVLMNNNLFTDQELEALNMLQQKHSDNILQLKESEYKNEMERLSIDLCWKSAQIEGNTYSLLETEQLLKKKETASGKTKDEAVMLLNHKDALDFLLANTDYIDPLSISKIENIHSILIKGLEVDKNIRKRRLGITGTNYRPLDNEFQIKEALIEMCELVNKRENIFEKALLVLLLISYIQPFSDGNKRTARIVSNALLIKNNYCPVSFRTVDPVEYKKAILLFYEQNNITVFKEIFIKQYEFAVNTYF